MLASQEGVLEVVKLLLEDLDEENDVREAISIKDEVCHYYT